MNQPLHKSNLSLFRSSAEEHSATLGVNANGKYKGRFFILKVDGKTASIVMRKVRDLKISSSCTDDTEPVVTTTRMRRRRLTQAR